RDVEHLRDLLIGVSEREQAHDLALALRERVGLDALLLLGLRGDEARAERRVDVPPAAGDLVDGGYDLGVGRFLEHVAGRSRGERLADVARVVLHGEHEHARLGSLPQDEGDAFDPALARHDPVHQHDVRLLVASLEDGGADVPGLRDHLDVLVGIEQEVQAGADHGVVVDDQDSDGFIPGQRSGTSATMVVPEPSVDSIASLPPSSPTRSFIPTSPSPSPPELRAPNPPPSSSTTSVTDPSRRVTTTLAWFAAACLATFVSASWARR